MTVDSVDSQGPGEAVIEVQQRTRWVPPPFPAGLAAVCLIVGFLGTRVFVGAATRWAWAGIAGTFSAVVGAYLALVAIGVLLSQVTRAGRQPLGFALRAVCASPVLLLDVCAMRGSVPRQLQFLALLGACCSLAAACVRGGIRTRGGVEVRLTLAMLFLGETVELLAPVLRAFSLPSMPLGQWAGRIEPLGELATFTGVAAALVWALRSTARSVGIARTAAFSAMPAALGLVVALLPKRYPITTERVARFAFGVRFDLASFGPSGHPTRATLAIYTLLFSALVAAASVSMAAQFLDQGASTRRTLGWGLILVSGFGAVTLAGPIDPLRVTTMLLGVLLLEQAAELEVPSSEVGEEVG